MSEWIDMLLPQSVSLARIQTSVTDRPVRLREYVSLPGFVLACLYLLHLSTAAMFISWGMS